MSHIIPTFWLLCIGVLHRIPTGKNFSRFLATPSTDIYLEISWRRSCAITQDECFRPLPSAGHINEQEINTDPLFTDCNRLPPAPHESWQFTCAYFTETTGNSWWLLNILFELHPSMGAAKDRLLLWIHLSHSVHSNKNSIYFPFVSLLGLLTDRDYVSTNSFSISMHRFPPTGWYSGEKRWERHAKWWINR